MVKRLIFFQNFVSIHQIDTLVELAKYFEVYLVASPDVDSSRLASGWNMPSVSKINFVDISNYNSVYDLCKDSFPSIYIFSGISAFRNVFKWFKLCLSHRRRVWVMLEPFDYTKSLVIIRKLKYWINFRRFENGIEALLPTGRIGCDLYASLGFDPQRIFEWGYFVNSFRDESIVSQGSDLAVGLKPSFIFVGQLCERKRVIPLCHCIVSVENDINSFLIVGDGDQRAKISEFVSGSRKISHVSSLPNVAVRGLLATYDWLVLPSRFDGWGAVVNEALLVGTRVIVSEDCGSSSLITNDRLGVVFGRRHGISLDEAVSFAIKSGITDHLKRNSIIDWSFERISSIAAASYFCSIVEATEGALFTPAAPWVQEEGGP